MYKRQVIAQASANREANRCLAGPHGGIALPQILTASSLCLLYTSQDACDSETIKKIGLAAKAAGADLQHIGDSMNGICPVSYTPLDVNKRQVQNLEPKYPLDPNNAADCEAARMADVINNRWVLDEMCIRDSPCHVEPSSRRLPCSR